MDMEYIWTIWVIICKKHALTNWDAHPSSKTSCQWDGTNLYIQIYFLTPSSLMFIVDTHFYSSFWTFWAIQKLEKTWEVSLQKSWWIHREEKLWLVGSWASIWYGGWWFTYPSEKYDLVGWEYHFQHMEIVIKLMFQTTVGMIISNIWKNNPNVPNHQPVYDRRCGYPLLLCSLLWAPES